MNADHRPAQLCCCVDESLLAGRQVDAGSVHAFAHGGHGTGTVLAAQRQDDHIRLRGNGQRFGKTAFILPGYRITMDF